MPAKKKITEEFIISSALEIVKERGAEGLNARSIAEKCRCSTQPLYRAFKNIDELKNEVLKRIADVYYEYIQNEVKSGKYPEYKAFGMGYIRFAKEQSEFFKCLFMCDRKGRSDFEDDDFEKVVNTIISLGLSRESASRLHIHMWIWLHGIATMYATGFLNWDWDTVSAMLTDEFTAMKEKIVTDGKK